MNRRFIFSALFVAALGFSVIYTHNNEIEKNDQRSGTEVIESNHEHFSTEMTEADIKMVQNFAQELERRLAAVTTQVDLKALVQETQEVASYMDELEETFDAELLKLGMLGVGEGLVLPVAWAAYSGKFSLDDPTTIPFIIGIIANAFVKAAGSRAGRLPKLKLSDLTTPIEIIKSLLGCGASIGLFIGLYALVNEIGKNMDPKSVWQGRGLTTLFYSAPVLANALPSLITVLSKRIEKRNATKHVIAHLRGY